MVKEYIPLESEEERARREAFIGDRFKSSIEQVLFGDDDAIREGRLSVNKIILNQLHMIQKAGNIIDYEILKRSTAAGTSPIFFRMSRDIRDVEKAFTAGNLEEAKNTLLAIWKSTKEHALYMSEGSIGTLLRDAARWMKETIKLFPAAKKTS